MRVCVWRPRKSGLFIGTLLVTLAPIVHQTQIAQCATDARTLAERAVAGRAHYLRAKSRVIRVKITRDQRVARSWLQCPCAPLRAEAGRKGREEGELKLCCKLLLGS